MAQFDDDELRHEYPLVRLGILRNGALVHANLAAFAMFGSYVAFQFIVTLYVQDSLGWSPITMALAFLPAGVIVVLGSTRIGPVLQRLGTATTILFGMLAFAIGYALFLRATPSMPYVESMLPTMLFLGIGFGLSFAALNGQATAGVADHEQGLASGLLNTSLQLGGAIVLAVVTAILGSHGTPVHDQLLPGMKTAIYVVVGVSVAAVILTLTFLYRARRQGEEVFSGLVEALATPSEANGSVTDGAPSLALSESALQPKECAFSR
jgi:predicted MFS family arabinose efflux permease